MRVRDIMTKVVLMVLQARRLLVFDRRRDLTGILSLDDVATRSNKEKLVGYALSKVAKIAHV